MYVSVTKPEYEYCTSKRVWFEVDVIFQNATKIPSLWFEKNPWDETSVRVVTILPNVHFCPSEGITLDNPKK